MSLVLLIVLLALVVAEFIGVVAGWHDPWF